MAHPVTTQVSVVAQRTIVACLFCLSGLPCRGMTHRTLWIRASHISVHNWIHSPRRETARPRKKRRMVDSSETKLKIRRREVFVWAATAVDTKERSSTTTSHRAEWIIRSFMGIFTPGTPPLGGIRRASEPRWGSYLGSTARYEEKSTHSLKRIARLLGDK